jgi:hypothetical protein
MRTPAADATATAALVYELLDAHHDTALLVEERASDDAWAAHLEYLRALQRRARETLARTAVLR